MKATLLTLAITSGMLISANAATLLFKLTTDDATDTFTAVNQAGEMVSGVTITPNGATVAADNSFTSATGNRLLIGVNNTVNSTTTTEGWSIKFDATLSSVKTAGWPVLCGAGSATGTNFKANYVGTSQVWSLGPEGTGYSVPTKKHQEE